MTGFMEKVTELCHWMVYYTMTETVLICLGCAALLGVLIFVGIRIIKVMIIGEDWDE
jgi:hypothetical protein